MATKQSTIWLKQRILNHINWEYQNWHHHKEIWREPEISVSDLLRLAKGWLGMDECPEDLADLRWYKTTKKLRARVQSACYSLVREGKLVVSHGVGISGKEAKLYELATEDNT